MRFVDVDPVADREAWLKRRRDGLGGSDVAKVLGISDYGTAWQVYVDKIGATPLDDDGNEDMRLGQRLEPTILGMYQEETGLWVRQPGIVVHATDDWMLATPDALAYETPEPGPDDTPVRGVDAKRSAKFSFDDGIPLDYLAQCQWYMLVTGLPVWDLAVLHPHAFRVYTIEMDLEDQATLRRVASEFWHDHVLAGKAPPVSGPDNDMLAAVWPTQTPETTVEVDEGMVRELVRVKAEQKRLEARRDELEATLKATLGDVEEGQVDGRKAVSWKAQTGGKKRWDEESFRSEEPFKVPRFTRTETIEVLDIEAIKKEEPKLYAKYDKPIRVFRTHVKADD